MFCQVLFLGCPSNSGIQGTVNQATKALARDAANFINFFQDNLGSCESFFQIADNIAASLQTCSNGADGSFMVETSNAQCLGGAGLNASVDFLIEEINCRDDNTSTTGDGTFTISLSFTSGGNFAFLASPGLVLNGVNFIFDGVEVQLKFSNNTLECNGSLNADGQNCDISSNCERCNL